MQEDQLVDSVFAGETVEAPPVEAPIEPTPEAPPEPQAEAAPQEPPVEAPAEPQPHAVPLTTLLDEREKRKAAEAAREAAEARLREIEAKAAPSKIPDPVDDPEGHARYLNGQLQQALAGERLAVSEQFAIREHGQETVDTAVQWAVEQAQKDPTFGPRYMAQPDPVGWIVRQHKQSALLSDVGDDLDGWFAKEAAKRGFAPQAAPPAPPAPASVAKVEEPPKSIAGEPAASGPVVDDKGDFLAGLVQR